MKCDQVHCTVAVLVIWGVEHACPMHLFPTAFVHEMKLLKMDETFQNTLLPKI